MAGDLARAEDSTQHRCAVTSTLPNQRFLTTAGHLTFFWNFSYFSFLRARNRATDSLVVKEPGRWDNVKGSEMGTARAGHCNYCRAADETALSSRLLNLTTSALRSSPPCHICSAAQQTTLGLTAHGAVTSCRW
jgi:hypothetical protein